MADTMTVVDEPNEISRYCCTGTLTSIQIATAPFQQKTNAHSRETRRKKPRSRWWAVTSAGDGAELLAEAGGQRAAEGHRAEEQGADGEVAQARLQEVEERAAGGQADHRARGDQGGADEQHGRDLLPPDQPVAQREVPEADAADERPVQAERDQCRVEDGEGGDRVLHQVPAGLAGTTRQQGRSTVTGGGTGSVTGSLQNGDGGRTTQERTGSTPARPRACRSTAGGRALPGSNEPSGRIGCGGTEVSVTAP